VIATHLQEPDEVTEDEFVEVREGGEELQRRGRVVAAANALGNNERMNK
jgi:hypothetical protein